MGMTAALISGTHEQKCRKAVSAREKNGFTAWYCATLQAAAEYIITHATDCVSIGFGGSKSIVSLGGGHVLVVGTEPGF